MISRPRSCRHLRTAASSSVALARLGLRTIGADVRGGKKIAFHMLASTPGGPLPFGVITVMPVTVPCFTCAAPVLDDGAMPWFCAELSAPEQSLDIRELEFHICRAAVAALAGIGRCFHLAQKRVHFLRLESSPGAH